MNQTKTLALILAAGKGTRMQSNIPKCLNPVFQKPILSWLFDAFSKNEIDLGIIINPLDKNYYLQYKDRVKFIYQNEPLGTGHAVKQAKKEIYQYDQVFVFVGDSPFVNHNILKKMLTDHKLNFSDCTILTSLFTEKKFPYARVIRTNGRISRIVEEKDASETELESFELFGSHYLFRANILLEFLDLLKPDKDNNEIYLTEILNHLIVKNKKINSLIIEDWRKLIGLNTKEDISWIESQKII
ncbi:MAG: UDP-N-acetylglucosamine pyrophosphorylase [Candidatus Marinimicrobia bacterium]|nr:UDP-N-acetylglucosamine pyrophosphorylase [Candidatus Neomarinimicrobiota bacterium]|tara:strand:- start:238 stop:966 length:729 start_codon:yes stop_codon:yes gene_type:complete